MINEQAKSPLKWIGTNGQPTTHSYLQSADSHVLLCDFGRPPSKSDALVASAYAAFDSAARELGVDATELAEKINLHTLLCEAAGFDGRMASTDRTREMLEGLYGVNKHLQP